jgi:hypothetical protein
MRGCNTELATTRILFLFSAARCCMYAFGSSFKILVCMEVSNFVS